MRKSSSIYSCLCRGLVVFFTLLCAACAGGGTSGTGLKTFTGLARTSSGLPVAGVRIVLLETGAQSVTNDEGHYEFQESIGAGSVDLSLENEGRSSSVSVSNLPSGDATVTVDISVDEQSRAPAPSSVQVQVPRSSMPTSSDSTENTADDTISTSEEGSAPSLSGIPITLIRGSLQAADGAPLAGVRVFSDELDSFVVTDENGFFEIEDRATGGQFSLRFEGENFAATATVVDPGNAASVRIALATSADELGATQLETEVLDVELRNSADDSTSSAQNPDEESGSTISSEDPEEATAGENPDEQEQSPDPEESTPQEDGPTDVDVTSPEEASPDDSPRVDEEEEEFPGTPDSMTPNTTPSHTSPDGEESPVRDTPVEGEE